MRLLRVIPSLDPRSGGPIEAARAVDQELLRQGHGIEVVCLDAPGMNFHSSYPAPVHAIGPSHFGYRYNRLLRPWLRDNRRRFDAVVVDGLWQYHAFGSWLALAGTDTPYFVYTHGMLDPWFKRKFPLKHLKKWLYWPWADYRVLRDASAVLSTSVEEREASRRSFSLYRCREHVATLGVAEPLTGPSTSREAFLALHPNLRGKMLILFVGRLHPIKGCDLLLDAFAKVADDALHLVMVGPDQVGWLTHLRARAQRLRISEKVTWAGMLSGEQKWSAYNAASVFCLPSHHENFGMVVAEALACGKPVLISNKVNIWREVEADGAGFVEEDTLEGTTSALARWMALSSESRRQMQLSARNCFETRFRSDRAVKSLLSVIQQNVGTIAGSSSPQFDATN